MSIEAERTVVDPLLDAAGRFIFEATHIRWMPDRVAGPLLNYLQIWGEPVDPLHPLYDTDKYDHFLTGYMPFQAITAVPFVVALGGLNRRNVMASPETFADIAQAVYSNIAPWRDRDNPRMSETVTAVRRALRITESLGHSSFLDQNKEARGVIKRSGFFVRRDLRTILS